MGIPFEMSEEEADRDFEELFGDRAALPAYQSASVEEDVEGTRQPVKNRRTTFSSTAETLKWARAVYGNLNVYNASHWQNGVRPVRKDMWGFQDVQVLDGLPGVLALQACGGGDVGAHQRKMAGEVPAKTNPEKREKAVAEAQKLEARVRAWLAAGNRLLMVAWRPVWVKTSLFHKAKKMQPRFLEAVLTFWEAEPGRPGREEREYVVEWIEHETWPPAGRKETRG